MLLEDAPGRGAENERRLAMNTAMQLWRQADAPTDLLSQIERAARSDAAMQDAFDTWLNPPPRSAELVAQEREMNEIRQRADAERAERDQSWLEFIDGLRKDPNTIGQARWLARCAGKHGGCRTYPEAGHPPWLMEKSMTLKGIVTILGRTGVVFSVLAIIPNNLTHLTPIALADDQDGHCIAVGGALMTNIGAIAGVTNLGPVSGDLSGSVAATILGQNSDGSYNVQHYWVTAGGETITLKQAVLFPTYPTSDLGIVAVPWGNYRSNISGGTGKFNNATGYLDYFGMADFHQNTLVLRYRGQVCFPAPGND